MRRMNRMTVVTSIKRRKDKVIYRRILNLA